MQSYPLACTLLKEEVQSGDQLQITHLILLIPFFPYLIKIKISFFPVSKKRKKNPKFICNTLFSVTDMQPHFILKLFCSSDCEFLMIMRGSRFVFVHCFLLVCHGLGKNGTIRLNSIRKPLL